MTCMRCGSAATLLETYWKASGAPDRWDYPPGWDDFEFSVYQCEDGDGCGETFHYDEERCEVAGYIEEKALKTEQALAG